MQVFDVFRLDTVNQCLWRRKERATLTPKAFDLLRYLVEHAGRLVTPDEILDALWPDAHVNPEGIRKYILEVRKVLGDNADKPAFIETVPKRGYQFIAAVSSDRSPSASLAGTTDTAKFVGRNAPLWQLAGHLDKAASGQRQVVFITGEAGVGKSTLVDVFERRFSAEPDVRVGRGQCIEGFGDSEAYYPLLATVGSLARTGNDADWIETLGKYAPAWLIQFPSLVKPDERESLRRDVLGTTRERMVREFCEALEVATTRSPLLLILEDLHWADPATLDLISALARRREPAKLLLVATYRPVDVVLSQSPLKALKHDLVMRRLGHEIALERLLENDVAEYLAKSLCAASLPAGLANLVHGNSGGNPLFMAAIVQDMANKGLIREEQGMVTLAAPLNQLCPGIPESLQEMLEIQLQRLTAEQRSILQAGSLAGERFSVWAVTAMLDTSPAAIEEECERLERQQFIRDAGMRPGPDGARSAHYEFRHSLYRLAIYRSLSNRRRSHIHGRLGARLMPICLSGRRELASEAALHLEQGRDYRQAARCLLLSAENAAGRFSHRQSIRTLQHALELVHALSPDLEVEILQQIGDAHYALGEMSDSILSYEKAAARAEAAGLTEARLFALRRLAIASWYVDPGRGSEISRQALELSNTGANALLAAQTQLTAASLRLLYDSWQNADAAVSARAQETIGRLSGSNDVRDPFYLYVLLAKADYAETLRQTESLIASAVDPTTHVLAVGARILALFSLGRFGEALESIRSGRESAERDGADPWMYLFREMWLRALCFDYQGVQALAAVSMRSNPREHSAQPQAIATVVAGYAELYRSNFAEAMRCFSQVLDESVTPRFFLHWHWRIQARLGITEARLCAGDLAGAHREADSLLERALSAPDPNTRAFGWEMKARVADREGDSAGAREFIGKALAIVEDFHTPLAAFRVHHTSWDLFRNQGDYTTAEAHRARAIELILIIADSFGPDEPLRESLLAAPPVRRIIDRRASV